ncbi:RICIN domain-containing protein [Ralstonia solanacearum]|uniref:RICIN domain-containing protein n=1 Tax=Ralstonia solanacearum TaxID=305 RepID=UPI0012D2D02F|nr:RICIN domain-containing protein [Ralstonia solanacearum]
MNSKNRLQNPRIGEKMSAKPYTIFYNANPKYAIGIKNKQSGAAVVLLDITQTDEEYYEWIIQDNNTIALRSDPDLILDVASLTNYQQFYLSVYDDQNVLGTQKWIYDGDRHFRNVSNRSFVIDNKQRGEADGNPIIAYAYNGSVAQEWNPKFALKSNPTIFYYGSDKRYAFGVKRKQSNQQIVLLDTYLTTSDFYEWYPQEDNTLLLNSDRSLVLDAASLAAKQSLFLSDYDSQNIPPTQQWMYDDDHHIRNVQDPTLVIDDKESKRVDGNTIWIFKFNGSDAQDWYPQYSLSLSKVTENE